MHIELQSARTVDALRYSNAASGGGTEVSSFPLLRVACEGLVPEGLAGLLLASDLQGIAPLRALGGATGLLGEAFVEWFAGLADQGHVPSPAHVGAILAGDLFSDRFARKRGATGDVGPAWEAFARDFAWVAGVAGNHDLFTSRASRSALRRSHVALLDGDVVTFDGLRIGGVGGIVGKKGKVNRRTPASFTQALFEVLADDPHIVVLHEGPPGGDPSQRGQVELEDTVNEHPPPLLVSGHVHWNAPFSARGERMHVNVDGRAVLLVPLPSAGS